MKEQIGTRLKAFRERMNLKMGEIEKLTGISRANLYKWEKGARPSDINDYTRLKEYLDKMELGIEEQTFANDTLRPATLQLPLNFNRASSAQTSGKAAAGTVLTVDGELVLIVDRINAPVLGTIEGVVEVRGESMEPTFKNGYRVAIARLKDPYILNWGEYYYIVDINRIGIVRRIHPGSTENSLLLVSDYEDQTKFPPFERTRDQILAIFIITATFVRV